MSTPQKPASRASNLLQFALIFATVYIGSQLVLRYVFPQQFGGQPAPTGVTMTFQAPSITTGHFPVLVFENHTATGFVLPARCPALPVEISVVEAAGTPTEKLTPVTASGAVTGCDSASVSLPPGGKKEVSLIAWKQALFSRPGTYEVRVPGTLLPASGSGVTAPSGSGAAVAPMKPSDLVARVSITEPGPFTKLFRVFILAPFLNFLIFIASLLPGHNLGIAIIIITLVIKALLYIPTKQALEGQKKMQLLQPKMDALKKQYPDNPQKVQEETMKLWKEYKVNPFQSCLPTLVQLPILIGLYYTIRDSSTLAASQHLLYPVYQNLSWDFGTSFLGLNLLEPAMYIMPPILVVLQFLQMKLAFSIQERKKKKDVIDVAAKGEKPKKDMSAMASQQQVMLYGLPLMIGFFALSLPAAVSLYWGVSTIFGIVQQVLVNREHLTVKS